MATDLEFLARCAELRGIRYRLGAEVRPQDIFERPAQIDCSEFTQLAAARTPIYLPDGSWVQADFCRAKGTYLGGGRGVERARRHPGSLVFREGTAIGHVVASRGYDWTWEARGSAYLSGSYPFAGRAFTGGAFVPGLQYAGIHYDPAQATPAPAKDLPQRPHLIFGQASGKCVEVAQYELNFVTGALAGPDALEITGVFDQRTLARVVQFQRITAKLVTGQLDPTTWAALDFLTLARGGRPGDC